jgi:hypothetical protein
MLPDAVEITGLVSNIFNALLLDVFLLSRIEGEL